MKSLQYYQKNLIWSKNYLRHRSYVVNVSNIFLLIKDSIEGKYTELDFSENIAMKPKFEVQNAHFSS